MPVPEPGPGDPGSDQWKQLKHERARMRNSLVRGFKGIIFALSCAYSKRVPNFYNFLIFFSLIAHALAEGLQREILDDFQRLGKFTDKVCILPVICIFFLCMFDLLPLMDG